MQKKLLCIVFLINFVAPNINPTVIPTKGPSTIAPIITGICIIVAFVGPIGIKP